MPSASPPHLQQDRWRLASAVVIAVLIGLSIWPIWARDFLPLHDAAQVQHQASILYDWNIRASFRNDYERLPYPTPNALGPYLITLFAPLLGVHLGFKLVLTLALLALPLAAWQLTRAARHSHWLVVAVLPWMWHQDVWVGHIGQIVGLPLLLALLATHLRFARDPGPWRALALVALLALLAVTDLLLWLTGAALLVVLAASIGWRRRRWIGLPLLGLREAAMSLPSIALLLPWYRAEWLGHGKLAAEWTLPLDMLKIVFSRLFDVFAPRGSALDSMADLLFNRPGDPISALWLTGMALWTLASVRQIRERPGVPLAPQPPSLHTANAPVAAPNSADAQLWNGSAYLGWAFTWAAAGLLLLPTHVVRPIWIYDLAPRLVTVMALLGALALPLRPDHPPVSGRWRTWAGTVALVVAAAWMAMSALRSSILTQEEYSYLRQALATIPPDKSLLVLRPSPHSRWMQPPIFHDVGQWWGAVGGGAAPFAFRDPALQPLRPRPERLRPTPPADDHNAFSVAEHGKYYDFIAVFRDPFAQELRAEPLLRSWPRLYHRGRWQVFQNLHPEPWPPLPRVGPTHNADEATADALLQLCAPWMGWSLWHNVEATDELVARREGLIRHLLQWPAREVVAQPPGDSPPQVGDPPPQEPQFDPQRPSRAGVPALQQRSADPPPQPQPEPMPRADALLRPLRIGPLALPSRATRDLLP